MKKFDLTTLRENPENPFPAKSKKDVMDLAKKIDRDPEFLIARPIAYDSSKDNLILGGNKRFIALTEVLGKKTVDGKYVIDVKDWSEEKKARFIYADNFNAGEWDMNFVSIEDANEWGIKKKKKKEIIEGDVEFSEFLNESNNYVVLFFDDDINWLQALTHFNLKTVAAKRANGNEWTRGIGRVVDGADYLSKLKGTKQ